MTTAVDKPQMQDNTTITEKTTTEEVTISDIHEENRDVSKKNPRMSVRELTELSVLCAMMFVLKEAMSFIPNVHPVALIIILCTIVYGWKALYPTLGFVLLEHAIYGVGLWSIMYIYVWPLLVIIAMIFRKNRNWIIWGIIAGIFGLTFGALCAIPYIVTSGFKAAVAWWISGIPFDLIHGASNFVIVTLLLPPLYKLLMKIKRTGVDVEQ